MRWLKIILQSVFYLAGTFLHEAAHYIAAALIARPMGFSLIPHIEGNSLVFGSVRFLARYRVALFFVGLAPLVWWYVLYRWLAELGVITTASGSERFFFDLPLFLTIMKSHLIWLWLVVQLLWAGKLSAIDIKDAVLGLLSFSGIVMIILAAAIYPFSAAILNFLKTAAAGVAGVLGIYSGRII